MFNIFCMIIYGVVLFMVWDYLSWYDDTQSLVYTISNALNAFSRMLDTSNCL